MKQFFAALLVLGLLATLSACGGRAPAPLPQQPAPQRPQPVGPATLGAAAQIFAQLPEAELRLTTTDAKPGAQADLDALYQVLLELKPETLTKFYAGAMPTDFVGKATLSKEDSAGLLDMLRLLEGSVITGELGNPPTGGGWQCYLETADDAFSLSYNGAWLMFSRSGAAATHIFACEDDNGVGTLLWQKQTDQMEAQTGKPVDLTYQGRIISRLYALDSVNYTTHLVPPLYAAERLKALEGYTSAQPADSEVAYLLVGYDSDGNEQKEYIYIGEDDASIALKKECAAAIANYPAHVHWFTHMSPHKLTKVVFSGYNRDQSRSLGLTISDSRALYKISDFLKNDFVVSGTRMVTQERVNFNTPAGLYTLELTFDTGVTYSSFGYDVDIWLYASDLGTTIGYNCDKAVIDDLRDLMNSF